MTCFDEASNVCEALDGGRMEAGVEADPRAVPGAAPQGVTQRAPGGARGQAVQVAPIKLALKAPGTKRLKLIHDGPLSNFAFNFNLRRYSAVR